MKEYELHLRGGQIASVCIDKYGFNLFELNEGYYLYDELAHREVEYSKIRIFKFE